MAENHVQNGVGTTPAVIPPPPQQAPAQREIRVVYDVIPVLDTARFEHMQRIASVMAGSSMVPDQLRGDTDNQTLANCFLVVNQAVRWGMDPFAVAQCVSVVHGKLCYEGKLLHAVIEAKLGIRLKYEFIDEDKGGQQLGIIVSGKFPDEDEPRTIEGRVKDWHKGPKSPWAVEGDWKRQLRYRGAREWARAHAPAVMLGAYSDDEMEDLREDRLAMRDITPPRPVVQPPAPPPHLTAMTAATTAETTTVTAKPEPQQSEARPSHPPKPPAYLRGTAPQSAGVAGEKNPAADAGTKRWSVAGMESQERGTPAASPSPSSRRVDPKGGDDGEGSSKPRTHRGASAVSSKFDGEKYLATLEHDISNCESMAEVNKVWEAHETFVKATPQALSEAQINRALGLYYDAQQVLGE